MSGNVSVRFSRGRWIVDTRESINGKRARMRKVFGKGRDGKAEAEAYADEVRQQVQ
jgi:hypothetical protein